MHDNSAMVGNKWMKRRSYLRISAALCQGWNENIVHHIIQKFVVKKCCQSSPKMG